MKHDRTLLITLIIGVVNIVINFICAKLTLINYNERIFLVSIQKYLAFYVVFISGIITAIIIVVILRELKNKQNHYMISLSLVVNIIYAVLYYEQVKNILLSTFN